MVAITLSTKARGRISSLLCYLCWAQTALGLVLVIFAAVPLRMISNHFKRIELILEMVFQTQVLCGSATALASFAGTLVSRAVAENSTLVSTKRAYLIWMNISPVVTVLVTVVIFTLPQAVDSGMRELEYLFQRGMRSYMHEARWKNMVDSIQQDYRCCGLNSYEDWFKTRWIPIQSVITEVDETVKSPVGEDGNLLVPILPRSCCSPELNNTPCLNDKRQPKQLIAEWASEDLSILFTESVYTTGCQHKLSHSVMAGLTSFNIITVLIIIIQVGVLIITKFLRDSLTERDKIKEEIIESKQKLLEDS